MDYRERYRRHVQNIRNETDNPAILNDVVSSELEQHPGQNRKQENDPDNPLSATNEVVRNNMDGKTWQNR